MQHARLFHSSSAAWNRAIQPLVHHSFRRKPRYDRLADLSIDPSLRAPIEAFGSPQPFYPHGRPVSVPEPLALDASSFASPTIQPKQWSAADQRCGVLAVKKGMMAYWDTFGRYMPVTVLQVCSTSSFLLYMLVYYNFFIVF
jgi:hypothetical protein